MRVYLPSTLPALAAALDAGAIEAEVGFAVTPALREWYTEGDIEELEYVATTAAARHSLRLLAAGVEPVRRVVVAAEVADGAVRPAPDVARAAVRLTGPVRLAEVVSAHVDDPSATSDVRAAVQALPAADAGDEDAVLAVEGIEDHELGWYAAQELGMLVALEC
ncbi:MAG: hypothetical protein QOI54_307 [Actinomycetota bacterium]|jgi:hypothetical protein|nr:hypothetical protein [Actinomycetota bacterium]